MLKRVEEYGRFLAISGFRDVKNRDERALLDVARKQVPVDVEVQMFNADLVATWQHLYFSALNALVAFQNKTNLSSSIAMETMLYASAQRQIKRALELIGLKPDTPRVAVLAVAQTASLAQAGIDVIVPLVGGEQDESVLELSSMKMKMIRKAFDIGDVELKTKAEVGRQQALVDAVVERVALLSTRL